MQIITVIVFVVPTKKKKTNWVLKRSLTFKVEKPGPDLKIRKP